MGGFYITYGVVEGEGVFRPVHDFRVGTVDQLVGSIDWIEQAFDDAHELSIRISH